MKETRPSLTAQSIAIRRAAHQLLDDPRVLDDPLAVRILGKVTAAEVRADPHRFEAAPLSSYLRAFVAARSRCAEDELALGIKRGVCQYVILGAGLDTFAYRNPHRMLHVFEVDHPMTQTWKMARLKEAGILLPENLTFAPIDFEAQTLEQGLRKTGCYDPNSRTFFSWLGVTEYLTRGAVMATLRFIASAPAGSGVVFDYMISPSSLTPVQRKHFDALLSRVASAGEPMETFFDPGLLRKDLQAMGFGHVDDQGPEEINARYFKSRNDGLRVGTLSRIMIARLASLHPTQNSSSEL